MHLRSTMARSSYLLELIIVLPIMSPFPGGETTLVSVRIEFSFSYLRHKSNGELRGSRFQVSVDTLLPSGLVGHQAKTGFNEFSFSGINIP